jgi:hypothetical protein
MFILVILRLVSRAGKNGLVFLRVAAGAIFGSSGDAKGGGGIALRAALIAAAFFLAAGVAGSVSLSDASEARAEPDPTTSEDPKKSDSVEDRVLNESPEDPYHQVVDDSAKGRFSAPGWDKPPRRTPGPTAGTTPRPIHRPVPPASG